MALAHSRPPGGDVHRREARLDLIAVAAATLAGALACAIELSSRSLWLDEGSSVAIASQHGAALWHGIAHDGGNMLAYYLLLHVVIAWFGDAAWVIRLPSVIAEAVTGGLVAAIALRLFQNRRLALAAGLLSVVSLPLVFWGQDARGYAALVALGTGSFLALVAIFQTPPSRAPSRVAVCAYVLTTLAALYVGYDVALLIPAQLALLLVFRERARLVIGCLVGVAILSVPLLVLAAERGSAQLFWVTPLSARIVRQAAVTLLSAGMPPNFRNTAITLVTAIVSGVAVIAALALAARAALPAARRLAAWPLLLLLAWAVIPIALALVLYAAGEPIELPRITILMIPALALLLAWLLLRARANLWLGTGGLLVLLVLRVLVLAPSYGTSPENWKAAVAYVLARTPAESPACIVFYPQDGRETFDYYVRAATSAVSDPGAPLRPVLPRLAWGTVRPFVEQYGTLDAGQRASIARQCPRLWLIGSHEGQRGGTRQSRLNLARYHRLEQGLRRLYPHTSLRDFGWAAPIHVRLLYR